LFHIKKAISSFLFFSRISHYCKWKREKRRDIYPNEIMEVIIAMNNGSHNLSGEAAFKKIGCGFCFELLYFSLADVVVAAVAVAVVVAVMQ
jgi:hypothetical protein